MKKNRKPQGSSSTAEANNQGIDIFRMTKVKEPEDVRCPKGLGKSGISFKVKPELNHRPSYSTSRYAPKK